MKVEGNEIPCPTEQKPKPVSPNSTTASSNTMFSSDIVSSSEDSDDDTQNISIKLGDINIKNEIVTTTKNPNIANKVDVLQHVLSAANSSQTLGNVFIEKSNGVHVGNVTYFTGAIHITHSAAADNAVTGQQPTGSKQPTHRRNNPSTSFREGNQQQSPVISSNVGITTECVEEEVEREEVNRSDAFIGTISRAIDGNVLRIVERRTWLAQKPLEPYEYLSDPAQYVIISHTGTEEGLTQAENVFLVRHIQCFHIESRRWNDIAYSFLIGCDGNVYEGRGWNVVGAHTYGYNKKSIGISFIGCFMKDKAPEIALKGCKLLIKRGIELGHILPDYILLGHCQCSGTESPGKMLFEEIQTWPHFSANPTV